MGLAVLVVGVGPLLSIVVAKMGWTSDPNPNPVGPGILAFFTLWPGIGLTVAGIIITATRWLRRAQPGRMNLVSAGCPSPPSRLNTPLCIWQLLICNARRAREKHCKLAIENRKCKLQSPADPRPCA